MQKVKTCVYAISLNEIKHVDKFMNANKGADLVLVCDTGSTDGTVERLKELGAVVYNIVQKPWRFDIPRNTALALIPEDIDICLSVDLDEYLQPGWVESIDKVWQEREGKLNRISYDYIWNWLSEGNPGVRFFADKIHHRKDFIWKHPCHETLYYIGKGQEVKVTIPEVSLHHHADNTKSRGQYLPLLKLAVEEDPKNDRMRHYYGRELMFKQMWEESIKELETHLALPNAAWKEERASSYRFMSRCYRSLNKTRESKEAALKATMEWEYSREPWLELARAAHADKDWHTCYWAATKCISIEHRTPTYMNDESCWGFEPYDHAALAAYYLGMYIQAVAYGQKAVSYDLMDERLNRNLEFYNKQHDEYISSKLPRTIAGMA